MEVLVRVAVVRVRAVELGPQEIEPGYDTHVEVERDAPGAGRSRYLSCYHLVQITTEVEALVAQRVAQLASIDGSAEIAIYVQKVVELVVKADEEVVELGEIDLVVMVLVVLFNQ